MTPLEKTTANQRRAADPARSAFVMANAGAGKTWVLANRVARLLLANVKPEKILCITFTKAAAAEMADRLFETLGKWALADDVALLKALKDLEGADAIERNAAALADARRLFARALETPGGLKIQTIHAFCEQVLRRFPLEAGAPPGFSVIEDTDAAGLLETALNRVAESAHANAEHSGAFARLAARRNETDLRKLVANGARQRLDFETMLDRFGGLDGALAALAVELNIDPALDEERIKTGFIATLQIAELERAQAALAQSGGNPARYCAPALARFLSAGAAAEQWNGLAGLFLTSAGAPREKIATNATDKIDPAVRPYLKDLQAAFIAANETLRALDVFRDTAAWLRLVEAVSEAYARMKSARAALDFNDLICLTEALFKNTASDWVMYKLDQGIDHVLVDEAQDTSPAQWDIIQALLKDWLSGAGAPRAPRSFFAVGDMKQSIYSFQGADAELFEEKETGLGKDLASIGDYENFDLQLSFRSTAPILDFVDRLFVEEAADGFGRRGIPAHSARREGDAGLVEIWPLTPRPEKPETNPWDAPVDAPAAGHPVQVLSERVAATIKGWLDNGERLQSRDRPVTPGDFIILVQSRGTLFDEVIRTLGRKGVPVAGADRLRLTQDPAVEDLLSYAKCAAFSGDDLSLAEILKSPLFNFDDDADLFPLAHQRQEGQSLWAALNERGDEEPHWRDAQKEIAIARAVGRKDGPYAFFSHVLETGAASGRKRFYRRLTQASRDAVDELLRQALDYEAKHPRALDAFAAWFETNAGEIKREMDRADDAVRVMTVHGAKGLEANIVFLLDAHRGPNIRDLGPVLALPRDAEKPGREKLRILVGGAGKDAPLPAAARDEARRKAYEEYRRLFYVAATRARDRLYVCGVESGNDKNPRSKETGVKSWHALALDAFDRLDGAQTADLPFWESADECARRFVSRQTAAIEEQTAEKPAPAAQTPPWLFAPAAFEAPPLRLSPSRLAGEEEARADAPAEAVALSPVAGDKYFRGRILHRLLELLPELAPDARADAADRLLERLAPEIAADERARWRGEVLAVIEDVKFSAAFGPGSRAEVSIAGAPKGARPGLFVSGQIDRLVVGETKVVVIDYKTNRPPPRTVEETAPAYIAQMAAYRALLQEIYPRHQIESALLWTFEARLMALPESLLDHAFARHLATG